MLKEAIEYIVRLSAPNYKEVEGKLYADRPMELVRKAVRAETVGFNTLDGLLEYVTGAEELVGKELFIHMEKPDRVSILGALDSYKGRETYARATAMLPNQEFGRYMDQESFGIYLRTHFVHDETVDRLLAFAGTVTGEDVQVLTDDGVSQQVAVRTKVSGNQPAIAPNECMLRPYRTFYEVEQPDSPFVFRCKRCKDGIGFALFEADGRMWQYRALDGLHRYVSERMGQLNPEDRTIRLMR